MKTGKPNIYTYIEIESAWNGAMQRETNVYHNSRQKNICSSGRNSIFRHKKNVQLYFGHLLIG